MTNQPVRTVPFPDLMAQWEPKLKKMSKWWIPYLDTEDVQQELLLVLWKCQQKYKENTVSSFHTYLHRAMLNRLGQLNVYVKRHNPMPESVVYLSRLENEESRVSSSIPLELSYRAEDPIGLLLLAAGLEPMERAWAMGKAMSLTNKEILKITGLDARTLRATQKTAMQKIRDLREDTRNAGTTKKRLQKSGTKPGG